MKKLRLIFCSFLAFIIMAVSMPSITNAATNPVCRKTTTLHYQLSGSETVVMESLYIGNLSSSAVITNIKSSNKHFRAAKSGLCSNAIWIDRQNGYTIKNGDKTTIRFNVKQNGKTYKLSSRITFKKFGQIFKSFKIGNKDYSADFTGYWSTSANIGNGKTGKVQVTPASGYKIDKLVATYWYPNGRSAEKNIKNGSTISLKNLQFLYVYYHPTKKPAYYKAPEKAEYSPLNYEFHVRPEN